MAGCGELAGIGWAWHRANQVFPSGPTALPGSVWSQVEEAAPLSEGLRVPLGAVGLSLFGFLLEFTATSLAEPKGAMCAVFRVTCSPM